MNTYIKCSEDMLLYYFTCRELSTSQGEQQLNAMLSDGWVVITEAEYQALQAEGWF